MYVSGLQDNAAGVVAELATRHNVRRSDRLHIGVVIDQLGLDQGSRHTVRQRQRIGNINDVGTRGEFDLDRFKTGEQAQAIAQQLRLVGRIRVIDIAVGEFDKKAVVAEQAAGENRTGRHRLLIGHTTAQQRRQIDGADHAERL